MTKLLKVSKNKLCYLPVTYVYSPFTLKIFTSSFTTEHQHFKKRLSNVEVEMLVEYVEKTGQ